MFPCKTISLLTRQRLPKQKAEIRKRAEDALRQAKATKDYEGSVCWPRSFPKTTAVMMGDHKSIHRGPHAGTGRKGSFAMQPDRSAASSRLRTLSASRA